MALLDCYANCPIYKPSGQLLLCSEYRHLVPENVNELALFLTEQCQCHYFTNMLNPLTMQVAKDLGPGHTVVTCLCDSGQVIFDILFQNASQFKVLALIKSSTLIIPSHCFTVNEFTIQTNPAVKWVQVGVALHLFFVSTLLLVKFQASHKLHYQNPWNRL